MSRSHTLPPLTDGYVNSQVIDERRFPALRLARSSRLAHRMARIVLWGMVLFMFAVLFAPWQQSIRGKGRVIAYAPAQRQQTVDAPVKGRVNDWDHSKIYEGARVAKGQEILQIQDIDPEYLNRLNEQQQAVTKELESNLQIVDAYTEQVEAFESARKEILEAADRYIEIAEQKVTAARQKLRAEQAGEEQARFDRERQSKLFVDGLASELKKQESEQKWTQAHAKTIEAEANLEAAQKEVDAKRNERSAKDQEAGAKIDSANAQLRKAIADVAKTEKERAEIQNKIARQEAQTITASRDGFILKLMVFQGGQVVKEGDPLFVLVPDTTDRAVELWVSGNDIPLISIGRHVRLQFEGWPAVQFAGWPSVAVGTFGGKVATVDATDDGKGQFRILVVPDSESPPWPAENYLRQGVRSNGWVLLNQVGLGYELWRRLNGFPQSLPKPEGEEKSDVKPPKLK